MDLIGKESLITLNFRFALADGSEVLSTFGAEPATVQLGQGKFGSAIEEHLIGLTAGAKQSFELAAGEAFGPRYEELVEHIARAELPADAKLEPESVLTFSAPDGGSFSGQILEVSDEELVLDFNHPLAGKALRFDVEIISVG
ncbi:FKBP-type peptidyl-prolyl cis-trans isomerase [Niveibacterium terrae]|uniref:FKBP-type peptidyl-prolyl cis-trans isomerase n=1 Tax=Niveibacterium terrae TaxID=3373598 RepID=UPI003A8D59FB